MAATTIDIAPNDTPRTATVTSGGTIGSKMVRIIVDRAKVQSPHDIVDALEVAKRTIMEQGPGMPQS